MNVQDFFESHPLVLTDAADDFCQGMKVSALLSIKITLVV